MKRVLVGALVGAIIIFAWQAISRMVLQFHNDGLKQAPNSEAILSLMASSIKEEGQYFLPDLNHNAGEEEMEAQQQRMNGKPWAIINYHPQWESNMGMAMLRQLLTMLSAIALFIWILGRNPGGFATVFMKTVAAGFLIFLVAWYPQNIWWQLPWAPLQAELIDLVVGWALCGLWLGWWLNRRTAR